MVPAGFRNALWLVPMAVVIGCSGPHLRFAEAFRGRSKAPPKVSADQTATEAGPSRLGGKSEQSDHRLSASDTIGEAVQAGGDGIDFEPNPFAIQPASAQEKALPSDGASAGEKPQPPPVIIADRLPEETQPTDETRTPGPTPIADAEIHALLAKLADVRPLIADLSHGDPAVRKRAAAQLAQMGDKARSALPALHKSLHDQNAAVRVQAARAIWQIDRNTAQVLHVLAPLVREQHPAVRSMAVYVIGEIGPPAAELLPPLRQELPQTAGLVRVHFAEAVLKIDPHDRPATEALLASLGDSDNDVRWLAACALEAASAEGRPAVVARLIEAVYDEEPRVRSAAALTLGSFGPAALQAVPVLREALHEPDDRVRESAAIALGNIELRKN